MDKLDRVIADLRAEMDTIDAHIVSLQRRREAVALRYGILQEAASLRPALEGPLLGGTPPAVARKGGRQPGSISKKWQEILINVDLLDISRKGLTFQEIYEITQVAGVATTLHSVRDRVRKYRDVHGYLEEVTEGRFKVSADALDRFHKAVALGHDETESSDLSEASNGDEDDAEPGPGLFGAAALFDEEGKSKEAA